jgi:peroxiredoxin
VSALAIGLGILVAPLIAAQVPRPAPEFPIRLLDGHQLSLSQFRGQVVALAFVQTTCPHCQHLSVLLNRMYKEYGPRGFQVLGVAFNSMATMLVPDFVKALDLTFPIGVGLHEEVESYLQHPPLEILYVPQLVFIDRQGIIQAQYAGQDDFFKEPADEANLRHQIEALLKPPAARPAASKTGTAQKPASLSGPQAIK